MSTIHLNRVLLGALFVSVGAYAGAAHAADPQNHADHNKQASDQPGSDTWITTKVKADLLTTKDVSGLELKVETVNGVVSLSGDVASKAEADRAISVAQGIEGVTRVDSSGITVRSDAKR
jgi:hyperosmotically inducible protein